MRLFLRVFAAAGLMGLVATASPCAARADLVGLTLFGNQLVDISTSDGTGTLLGTLATPASPYGLAARGNQVYTFDATSDLLRQIDPATGNTLATIDVGIGPVLGQGGLAFNAGGIGFLTSSLDPTTLNPANDLYKVDITAGTSSLVAHLAVALEGIAFDSSGTLFGLGKLDGNLYKVDPTTGATTLVGNTGVSVGSPVGALTFSSGGQLFATLDDALYTLDPTTGLATPVNPDPTVDVGFSSISGLVSVSVPEPSPLLLMGTAIATMGLVAWRRKAVGGETP